MPSLSEIFGATTASKPKLSFGEIFGGNDYPSAPFVNQPTLTPPAPQPESRDPFLDGPTLPPMAQGWEEIAAKHQDEWVNGAYQVDPEPFRLSYEREADPDLKTQYWYDWQNALQSNKTRRERIDKERTEMESLGLSPEQYWQKQLYDAEQNSEGVNRLGNAGPFLGLKNAVTAVPSVLAEGALRAIPNNLPYGLQASQLADTLARTRADDEAYSQYADKQQGAPSKYARQVTEMLTKYVPIGATTGPTGLLPFIFTEAQSGAYVEGQKAGLKGGALDAYANGIGTINAAFTYLGGKIAQKLGTGTIEEFGMQGVPLSTGVKDFFAKYLKGAASETLAEEVPTYLAENYARYVAGISEDATPETWQQDLVDIAVVSTLAQSASSLSHVGDDTRQFLENPTVETAKKAGLPPELVKSREDAESLAVQVADEIAEKSTEAAQAPETPVDAIPENPTSGPEVPAEVAQEQPQEAELPVEPALPVQADSAEAGGGNFPTPDAAPRKRRLGDRKAEVVEEDFSVSPEYLLLSSREQAEYIRQGYATKDEQLLYRNRASLNREEKKRYDALRNWVASQPTPSVAPPDAPPVATSQVTADSGVGPEVVAPTFREAMDQSDAIQREIDSLHDRLEAEGVPFQEQLANPEVTKLYNARIAVEERYMRDLKRRAGKAILDAGTSMESDSLTEDYRKWASSRKESNLNNLLSDAFKIGDQIYFLSEYGSKPFSDKAATVDGLAERFFRDWARDTGKDAEGIMGRGSGLTDAEKEKTAQWFRDLAGKVFDSVAEEVRRGTELESPQKRPPEVVAPTPVEAPKKSIGKKKQPAKVQEEVLPDWVTDDDFALEKPSLLPKQKAELSRVKRRLKQKLDPETFDEIAGMSERDQHVVASEADRRADAQNAFIHEVLDDFNQLQAKTKAISLISRNKERAGKDASRIPGFDELVKQLRDGALPSLAAYADSRGQGDLEAGLFDILQGGKKAIEAELVGPESHAFDVLEEYRERLERSPEEEGGGVDSQTPEGGFADEAGDSRVPERDAGDEADDFQLSGEGSKDTTPVVDEYKVPDKDRLPSKKKTERQPQLLGLPEDLDENVLEGQRGLFESQASAAAGEQLQPAARPKVIVTPPKSQRQIIAELSKALDIPIRFGRQLDRSAGGLFYRVQNIITSKFANDVPVVTHEVGHKLDSMFELSRDKKIADELDRLGDPATEGSRSSWTKSKSKTYKRGEGMAEFVRYWMTEPKKAKAEAPGTYAAFEAVLDANKDLGDTLRQAQEDIRLWRTAEPQARLRSQISIGENPNKTRYSLSQLTRDLVDDLHYLRLASEDAKLGNPDLKPSENPYLLARNLRGSYGMASTFIQQGAVDFNSKDVALGTSLEDALKPVAGRINDFRDWIVAKRVLELESQGRPTGFVLSDAEGVAKKLDSPEFQKAFNDVKRWNDAVLQYAVDAGLVTKSSAEAMRKMNQDYVPFHRLFEVGANEAPSNESTGKGSGLNPGKPGSLKRLKGSQRNVVDPLETMVKNAYAIITASEKSAISLAVADMAKLPNMGKWVEKVAGPMKETRFSINDIRDQLEDMGADLSGVDEKGGDDMLNIFRQATRPPKGENTISVVRDGKTEFYRLNRYLHDTFEALDLDDAGKLVRILSAPAQVLRAGVTLEPGFNFANAMRDTVGASVIGKYGALPFETTIRGIAALVNNPQLVAEWAASGGRSSVEANYFDRKKMQKYLAERIAKDLTPAERALIVAKSPLTALRWMATTFEEATRIGEYQKAYDSLKKSGLADGEARRLAAFEARDRQDFAKGGAKTKILRHVAAFWNAQLQANVRLAQAFKEKPLETTIKGLAFVTLPKLIEQALNWDDEDYWERPQWERDLFYMIPIGKDDAGHTRFLRVPTPFEIGVIFGTIPGRFLQWAKENNPDAVKGIPSMFLKQTIPIPNPSGGVTAIELMPEQGYSIFRGREIVPDSIAKKPADLEWTAQTSTLAKKVGATVGVSPMKIDYLIESLTGGTGKVAMGKQVPGQRFFSNPLAVTGQPINDFYEIRDKLTEDFERLKDTGEHQGFGPVMLSEFEDVGEKIGTLRNKSREETDPIKKAKIEDEAYQLTREMVQKYRENPEPEEAVQKYAEKQAKKVVLSSDRPVQKKKKLGSKEEAETDEEYKKRLADWEEGRDASLKWLRKHKDSPAVQAAVKEVAKDIPPFPQYKGKLDVKLGAKRKEWREKYGDSAKLIESMEQE